MDYLNLETASFGCCIIFSFFVAMIFIFNTSSTNISYEIIRFFVCGLWIPGKYCRGLKLKVSSGVAHSKNYIFSRWQPLFNDLRFRIIKYCSLKYTFSAIYLNLISLQREISSAVYYKFTAPFSVLVHAQGEPSARVTNYFLSISINC